MMFMVSQEDAAAIRTMFEQEGELSAAIELRRRFPGIADNAKARECVRTIAGWQPPFQRKA
jgi:RecB family exonuclease